MTRLRGFRGGLTAATLLQNMRELLSTPDTTVQWVFGNFSWKSMGDMFPLLRPKSDHLVDYRALYAANARDVEQGTAASVESLTAVVAKMFAIDAKGVDATTPLTQFGLDSLLAVELSATLRKTFNIKLTQMELLGGITIEKILARAQ